jgi:hypothetical protein
MTPSPILTTLLPLTFGAAIALAVAAMVVAGETPSYLRFHGRVDGEDQEVGLYWAVLLGVALSAALILAAGFVGAV